MKPFNIFIGYDPNEHEAYQVAALSILRRTTIPVLIHPLSLPHLSHIVPTPVRNGFGQLWDHESDAPQSTEFARSRFIVPRLQLRGFALFIDCDMVVLADIAEILDFADESCAVQVVQHDHRPKESVKMINAVQTAYPRKNWSSVILWNCSHPGNARLSEYRLNTWPGRDLHAFKWLQDDEIGILPKEWNYLVGVDRVEDAHKAKILHYTLGGPWFREWTPQFLDDIWITEKEHAFGKQ